MKILHVQQYFNEGYGYQENILPKYQQDLGNEVIMLTSTRSDGFNGEDRIIESGLKYENGFPLKRIDIKWEFKKRFVQFNNLYSYLEEEKPDYIYHHSVNAPSIFTVSRYKKNHPQIILAMDNHADLQISGRNKLWKIIYYNIFWKYSLKIINKYVDVFFGVTPDRCLFLENELGISHEKIKLLPIGADVNKVDQLLYEESPFKNNDGKKILVHGGKMSFAKKTDELINAFKSLDDRNWKLVLFGSFENDELNDMILNDNRICFLGWLDRLDTLKLLLNSDLGIWNSQHTTLMEDAVACNLPLVLKKYGSTSHLIKENGVFLETGDQKEIKNVLQTIFKNSQIDWLKKHTEEMKQELSYNNIAKLSIELALK